MFHFLSTGDFGGRRGGSQTSAPDSLQLSSDYKASPTVVNFEAGDRFVPNSLSQETFDFAISHIESANEFYIQLYSNGTELTNLTNTLQEDFKQAPGVDLRKLHAEQACLARSSDGCWYRGKPLGRALHLVIVRIRFSVGPTTRYGESQSSIC